MYFHDCIGMGVELRWDRENLPEIKMDRWWKWLLLPGVVILWFGYMFPDSGVRGAVVSAKQARSPIMTIYYSLAFYGGLLFLLFLVVGR
jgi:hypothetical protein